MSFQVGPATVTPVVEMVDRSFDVFSFFPEATEDALLANLDWTAPHHFDPHSAGSGVFTGDILHHPVQVLNPQWSCMGCLDPEQAGQTRVRILARCAADGTILFPGHFMSPHATRISETSDGFAFRFFCEEVADEWR